MFINNEACAIIVASPLLQTLANSMTARRLSFDKKLRGIPRRLKALKRWAETWSDYFPSNLRAEDRYWNVKIPVITSLVQGKQTSKELQSFCAQQLINATHKIYLAKPDASNYRVTCCIVLPDMFASELCIYIDENYFNEHTSNGLNRFGLLERIQDKSLAKEWGLEFPENFSEIGITRTMESDDGKIYVSENWYFGDLSPKRLTHHSSGTG
jgi:hypothetical protein